MNTSFNPYYWDKPKNFIREEKLKQSQSYKKANQKHPAFKK